MFKLILLVTALTMASGIPAPMEKRGAEQIRSVVQFNEMISCSTTEGFLSAIIKYNGYGCYCGFGGDGAPVDEVDKCCQVHDACYDQAKKNSCFLHEKYTATYHYNKWRNILWDPNTCQITCRPASGYAIWEFNEDCKSWMCECDRQGALCFGRTQPDFNAKYLGWPQSNCKAK